jgi:hypothetical protein
MSRMLERIRRWDTDNEQRLTELEIVGSMLDRLFSDGRHK